MRHHVQRSVLQIAHTTPGGTLRDRHSEIFRNGEQARNLLENSWRLRDASRILMRHEDNSIRRFS